MEVDRLRALLEDVRGGGMPIDEALGRLRDLPYEDLGFAKVDHHRALRNGYPEVIFCQGKSVEHIIAIAERLSPRCHKVLGTRAAPEVAEAVLDRFPAAVYHAAPRLLVIPGCSDNHEDTKTQSGDEGAATVVNCLALARDQEPLASAEIQNPKSKVQNPLGTVLVVAAGTADFPVAEEAAITAAEMGSPVERLYDVGVAGLHRLLDRRQTLIAASVVIVVAGMEGALASVVGGLVSRPVVAVPTSVGYGASFQGLAALLTMLNSCASGVAVMNIDNGFGAGYFAHMVNVA